LQSAGIYYAPESVFKEPQTSGNPDTAQFKRILPDGALVKTQQFCHLVHCQCLAKFLPQDFAPGPFTAIDGLLFRFHDKGCERVGGN